MSALPPLPEPFLEERHRALGAALRSEWAAPFAAVRHVYEAGQGGFPADEDVAARALVEAMGRGGRLESVIHGDVRSLCVARQEAARLWGFGDNQLVLQGLGSHAIVLGGDAAQIDEYARPAACGTKVAAFALTEPEAGSDVQAMTTTARPVDGGYLVDGTKVLITNAGVADFYTLVARLPVEAGAKSRHVVLIVEADSSGLSVAERLQPMSPHPLGRLDFTDCFVPTERRVGAEGEGLALAFGTLERFRPTVGAAALGFVRRALEEALGHTQGRTQFGKPLADFQLVRAALADTWAELETASLAVMRAAWLLDDPNSTSDDRGAASSMAKLVATEWAQRGIDRCLQMHGGRGVLRGETVEELYRDIRALRIYEGTSEIQRLILGRAVLKRARRTDEGPES